MRITPVILIAIGIWGLFYPETMLDHDVSGGRWVFVAITALGIYALWRTITKMRQ